MKTILSKDIPAAAELLRAGQLVAVPTETVYGLAANGLDAEAVAALYRIKARPAEKPISLLVSGAAALEDYCRALPKGAKALAERFWPGPLTLILPAKTELLPQQLLAGGDTVGLRCPRHPMTLELLAQCGLPLAAPSANPSGKAAPTGVSEVAAYFDGKIPLILDGGDCALGTASTVLDMSCVPYRLCREGAISRQELGQTLAESLTVIGFTGGSGCGKTTALRELEKLGGLAIDCDAVYHRLLQEDGAMLAEIAGAFPAAFPEGTFQRKALGRIVFADPAALERLNRITHRHVEREVRRLLAEHALAGGTLAGIDAIALVESGLGGLCTATIGVTAPVEIRVQRLMAREGISEAYARSRIAAQQPEEFFQKHCTYTLCNAGSREEFARAAHALLCQCIKEEG